MTHQAFRSHRGLVGGLALLVFGGLALFGLSACGAPAYTYVTDSADQTYYKVPASWHAVSATALGSALNGGQPITGQHWLAGFDAASNPSADRAASFAVTEPFAFSLVLPLSSDASNSLSYNSMRDFLLPVTAQGRQNAAAEGETSLTGFRLLRDDTVTGKGGIHGIRDTFQYTLNNLSDTWDEDVLTNADETIVYFLMVHCTNACYSKNQTEINTVMSSFTVGSS